MVRVVRLRKHTKKSLECKTGEGPTKKQTKELQPQNRMCPRYETCYRPDRVSARSLTALSR
jgi:hypothetical protein